MITKEARDEQGTITRLFFKKHASGAYDVPPCAVNTVTRSRTSGAGDYASIQNPIS